MSTNTQTFRDSVDAAIKANRGDAADQKTRLGAARQLIRDLQDAGEEVPSPDEYRASLTPRGTTPGWGPDSIKARQSFAPEKYGMAAFREANAMAFAEAPKATPRTSAECHRAADVLAKQHPE